MAQIVGGGPPVNDWERKIIARFRDEGPAEWLVLHNVEIPVPGETFEIDVIVVTAHAVYAIDVKGTRGRIEVAGSRWLPEGRQSFHSPLAKLKSHARAIKGLLQKHDARLRDVYVCPLVVLTAPGATLVDPMERDAPNVVTTRQLIGFVRNGYAVPERFQHNISSLGNRIVEALTGVVRYPTGPMRLGTWEVVEDLGGDEHSAEYRARNMAAPPGSGTVLLRVYQADPFLPEKDQRAQRLRIGNAYEALSRMPAHPNVVAAKHFTPIEDEARFVLELEDVGGQAVQAYLTDPQAALGMDAKLRIVGDVLRGLAHAHANRVTHRALSPRTVLVASDGRGMLTGFDYARVAGPRDHTVAGELAETDDAPYLAPECHNTPEKRGPASDLYAAGVIAFQLFTGDLPFASSTEQFDRRSALPMSELRSAGVDEAVVHVLQRLCAFDPRDRPSAGEALRDLIRVIGGPTRGTPEKRAKDGGDPEFYRDLPEHHQLTRKYTIRKRLGTPGTFGVAYRVYDVLARTDRALKLVLKDRESVLERLQHEYQILLNLPAHPHVVAVRDADFLPGSDIPYLVFDYVPGNPLSQLLSADRLLGPADVLRLGIDAASGLAHLHQHGVFHCDVKPSNLLWTDGGCTIIDFNVAVTADSTLRHGGGSARYLPPDLSLQAQPSATDLADRDTYALGVSLYEALTGSYPWTGSTPLPGQPPIDPRTFTGFHDLSPRFVDALCTAIVPRRSERFSTAQEFLQALEGVDEVRVQREPPAPAPRINVGEQARNPFVDYLQTLYSQSSRSNRGTRGHDPAEMNLYVATALDQHLLPDVLAAKHRLVVITGNAGDGKTAFLEHLVAQARDRGAQFGAARENGADFTLDGRSFVTNHDGSQDEGDRVNDEVLLDFFRPFSGAEASSWPQTETRLIAINEGRLVDFLAAHEAQFGYLRRLVTTGLAAHETSDEVAVVNLNSRSVVADAEGTGSVFDRMLDRMTHERFWEACAECPLSDRCYAPHNARTFAHPNAGPKIRRRLRTLFTLAHLRGRLHITLRDLRSALAYMLTSGRSCEQIHDLYVSGESNAIADSFYFTSWGGPDIGQDRLLAELRQLDTAEVADPELDRRLDYVGPEAGTALITVDGRGDFDTQILRQVFSVIPRGATPDTATHRRYVAAAKRRFYFECQDEDRAWRLLPYLSAREFLDLLNAPDHIPRQMGELIDAINRGEGLVDPRLLGDALALQVRHVRSGTIHSYRLFPADQFTLEPITPSASPYVEGGPEGLLLRHRHGNGDGSTLAIRLDAYELLHRLRNGYLPGIADLQGQYLALTIFKNALSAMPYQELVLASTKEDLHHVRREPSGRLVMARLGADD